MNTPKAKFERNQVIPAIEDWAGRNQPYYPANVRWQKLSDHIFDTELKLSLVDLEPSSHKDRALVEIEFLERCYENDQQIDRFVQQGMVYAIRKLKNCLVFLNLPDVLQLARKTLEERLSVGDDMEVLYLAHSFESLRPKRLFTQDQKPVTDGEKFFYGFRLAFEYGTIIIEEVATESYQDRTDYGDRPAPEDLDLVANGLTIARETIVRALQQSAHEDELIEDAQILPAFRQDEAARLRLIDAIRANTQTYWTFKLGYGNAKCKPNASNRIFDRAVPACQITLAEIEEVVTKFFQAGDTPNRVETWLDNPYWVFLPYGFAAHQE